MPYEMVDSARKYGLTDEYIETLSREKKFAHLQERVNSTAAWNPLEARVFYQCMRKYGSGSWDNMPFYLPHQNTSQYNVFGQRLMGQQSLAPFSHLPIDPYVVWKTNAVKPGLRKSGVKVHEGKAKSSAEKKALKIHWESFSMDDQSDIPLVEDRGRNYGKMHDVWCGIEDMCLEEIHKRGIDLAEEMAELEDADCPDHSEWMDPPYSFEPITQWDPDTELKCLKGQDNPYPSIRLLEDDHWWWMDQAAHWAWIDGSIHDEDVMNAWGFKKTEPRLREGYVGKGWDEDWGQRLMSSSEEEYETDDEDDDDEKQDVEEDSEGEEEDEEEGDESDEEQDNEMEEGEGEELDEEQDNEMQEEDNSVQEEEGDAEYEDDEEEYEDGDEAFVDGDEEYVDGEEEYVDGEEEYEEDEDEEYQEEGEDKDQETSEFEAPTHEHIQQEDSNKKYPRVRSWTGDHLVAYLQERGITDRVILQDAYRSGLDGSRLESIEAATAYTIFKDQADHICALLKEATELYGS